MGKAAMKVVRDEESKTEEQSKKPALKLIKGEGKADTSPAGERFIADVKGDWSTFTRMVRNLLRGKDKRQKELLRAVEITLDSSLLSKLVASFDTQERTQWREVSASLAQATLDMERSYGRLRLEMRKASLASSSEESLSSMISSMHEDRASEFVKKYPQSAPSLLQRVAPDIAAAVLNELKDEEARSLVDLSLSASAEDEEVRLKKDLAEYLGVRGGAFKQGLPEAVVELSQSKGDAVLGSLLECGEWGLVRSLALKSMPPALFPKIRTSILREALAPIPLEEKVSFIATRSAEDEQTWINLMAEEGSKAREMLDLEIEQIKANADSLSILQSQKSSIEKDFYSKIRSFLNSDEHYPEVVSVVDAWIDEERSTYEI